MRRSRQGLEFAYLSEIFAREEIDLIAFVAALCCQQKFSRMLLKVVTKSYYLISNNNFVASFQAVYHSPNKGGGDSALLELSTSPGGKFLLCAITEIFFGGLPL